MAAHSARRRHANRNVPDTRQRFQRASVAEAARSNQAKVRETMQPKGAPIVASGPLRYKDDKDR
jgi:hypothetical protein